MFLYRRQSVHEVNKSRPSWGIRISVGLVISVVSTEVVKEEFKVGLSLQSV